jgi:hypothetical protein
MGPSLKVIAVPLARVGIFSPVFEVIEMVLYPVLTVQVICDRVPYTASH